jgi:choline dehydrogenase-like flavoprotein
MESSTFFSVHPSSNSVVPKIFCGFVEGDYLEGPAENNLRNLSDTLFTDMWAEEYLQRGADAGITGFNQTGYLRSDFEQVKTDLLAYFVGYLTAINEQDEGELVNVTPAQVNRLNERIFGVNAAYEFEFNQAIIDNDSVLFFPDDDNLQVRFNAALQFTSSPRGGGEEVAGANTQSITMIQYDGQWYVDSSQIFTDIVIGENQTILTGE